MSREGIKSLKSLSLLELRKKHPNVPDYAIPTPRYTDRTSNGLTECVIDWVNFNGFQAERINSTGRHLDSRKTSIDSLGRSRTVGSVKWIKGSSQIGTADVSATLRGRSVKIEIKCKATGDNYQSQGQKDYQKHIEKAGGVYIIVREFQGFYEWYNEFIKEVA